MVEEEAAAAMQDIPELQSPHLDDVFLEGPRCPRAKGGLRMGCVRAEGCVLTSASIHVLRVCVQCTSVLASGCARP